MSATRNEAWTPIDNGAVIGRTDVTYTSNDVADMLDKAERIGLDLSPVSALNDLTVRELAMLVMDVGQPS